MDLPSCALPCFISAVGNSTCALTDIACVCGTPQIAAQIEPCILGACSIKDALTSKNMTYATCDYPLTSETEAFAIVAIVGIIVASTAVLMRLANRALDRKIGLDDYVLIFTLLLAASTCGVGIEMCKIGLGKDMWTISFDNIQQILKLFFIDQAIYCACIATIKISMLCLYLEIFPNRGVRIPAYTVLAVTLIWGIISVFILIFSCKPVSYYWTQWDGEHVGKCLNQDKLLLAHSIVNIILDVLVIIIPMPTLARLQMPLEKKLGVCAMFAVGAAVTVISIVRLVKTVGFNKTANPTRDFAPVGMISTIEFEVGIVWACMPAIRSLVIRTYRGHLKPRLASLSDRLTLSGSTQVSSQNTSKNSSKNGSNWGRHSRSHHLSTSISGSRTRTKGGSTDEAVGPFIRLDDLGTAPEDDYNGVGRGGGDGGLRVGYGGRPRPGELALSGPAPGSSGVGPAPGPTPSPRGGFFKR